MDEERQAEVVTANDALKGIGHLVERARSNSTQYESLDGCAEEPKCTSSATVAKVSILCQLMLMANDPIDQPRDENDQQALALSRGMRQLTLERVPHTTEHVESLHGDGKRHLMRGMFKRNSHRLSY